MMAAKQETTRGEKAAGIGLNALAAVSISLCGIIVKYSHLGGNTASLGVGMLGFFLGIASFFLLNDKPLSFSDVFKTFLNGFFNAGLFNFLYFLSIDYITVADANAVNYFSAFTFSLILEIIVLRLVPHWSTVITSLIGLTGLVCISQSKSDNTLTLDWLQLFGVLLATLSGFFGALFYVVVKQLNHVHDCLLMAMGFTGSSLFPLIQFYRENMELQTSFIGLRFLALIGYLFYVCCSFFGIAGTKLASPSISLLTRTLSIVLSYVLQVILLDEHVILLSVIGCTCICFSIAIQSFVVIQTAPKDTEAHNLQLK